MNKETTINRNNYIRLFIDDKETTDTNGCFRQSDLKEIDAILESLLTVIILFIDAYDTFPAYGNLFSDSIEGKLFKVATIIHEQKNEGVVSTIELIPTDSIKKTRQ